MVFDVTVYDVQFKRIDLDKAMFVDKEGTRGYVVCGKSEMLRPTKWGGNTCDIIQCEKDKPTKDEFECSRLNNVFAVFLDGDKVNELDGFEQMDSTHVFCLDNETAPVCKL